MNIEHKENVKYLKFEHTAGGESAGTIAVVIPLGGTFMSMSPTGFWLSLQQLRYPPEYTRLLIWGGGTFQPEARNELVMACRNMGVDIAYWFDADMTFGAHTLMHLHTDIVGKGYKVACGWYCDKNDNYRQFAFVPSDNGEGMQPLDPRNALKTTEIEAGGTGVMATDMSIFDEVPEPWFELTPEGVYPPNMLKDVNKAIDDTLKNDKDKTSLKRAIKELSQKTYRDLSGKRQVKVKVSEDVVFCDKVRELGHKISFNPKAICGHVTSASVFPRIPGQKLKREDVVCSPQRFIGQAPHQITEKDVG